MSGNYNSIPIKEYIYLGNIFFGLLCTYMVEGS